MMIVAFCIGVEPYNHNCTTLILYKYISLTLSFKKFCALLAPDTLKSNAGRITNVIVMTLNNPKSHQSTVQDLI